MTGSLSSCAAAPVKSCDAASSFGAALPESALTCPQVTLGPDGQIVMNEAALTVQAQPETVVERRTVVSDQQLLNSQSYAAGRAPNDRWTVEETENFFQVCTSQNLNGL